MSKKKLLTPPAHTNLPLEETSEASPWKLIADYLIQHLASRSTQGDDYA